MEGWYWSPTQQRALEAVLARTHDARTYRRALGLSLMGQGLSADEVAQLLHVDRRSVYRWMERFVATGDAEALEDGRVQGALPKWDQDCDSLLETALAQTPAQLGYPANRWTVPVLQAFLAVYHPECALSAATVRRRLRALGYVWKRFRYVLAPDPEAEKKTPNPGGHPGFAAPYGPVDRG